MCVENTCPGAGLRLSLAQLKASHAPCVLLHAVMCLPTWLVAFPFALFLAWIRLSNCAHNQHKPPVPRPELRLQCEQVAVTQRTLSPTRRKPCPCENSPKEQAHLGPRSKGEMVVSSYPTRPCLFLEKLNAHWKRAYHSGSLAWAAYWKAEEPELHRRDYGLTGPGCRLGTWIPWNSDVLYVQPPPGRSEVTMCLCTMCLYFGMSFSSSERGPCKTIHDSMISLCHHQ